MTDAGPLSAAELEARLDAVLEVEFTRRNTREAARSLAGLRRGEQAYLEDWTRRVASTNLELGFQFACHAAEALAASDAHMIEAWALHAMDLYDREGLRPALAIMRDLNAFLHSSRERASGCVLEEQQGVLTRFLHGLSGRRLKIKPGECFYTDTETLFMPAVLARLEQASDNFLLYKGAIVGLWAQTRFGTLRHDLVERLMGHPEGESFLALFHALDSLRLDARIRTELPGLARELRRLGETLEERLPPAWRALESELADPACTARDVLAMTERLLGRLDPYAPRAHHGRLELEAVHACMCRRLEKEKLRVRVAMRDLLEEEARGRDGESPQARERRITARETGEETGVVEIEILLDGRPMPLPEEIQETLNSVIQDLGNIPDEYLEPAGPGEYDPAARPEKPEDADDVWSGVYHEEGAHLYPEWDYKRQHYRKNWCAVREKSVRPLYDDFYERTLEKYAGLVAHLRKTFEAMRDEDRLLKRQIHGDDVDLDALVEALADARDGREMSDRLFTRMHRTERNIAVVFMVDMSGSTRGWINDAERESLILLSESLEALGDRYAIYGFSSQTRKRCELFHVKHFDEPYDAEVRARIGGIEPQDYTRMGFAIRHLTEVLNEVDARTRILITLSDGKPDDYDTYRGEYGIEDTRRALIEARRQGVHPYCITIDEEARDYLPHLYGSAAYTVVDEVRALPFKVSDIYRRLTT